MSGSSQLAVVAALADAIAGNAAQVGAASPAVRGADWQTAVVTAVGSDGTVTAAGIIARRARNYGDPTIGDLIVLTNSGAGNWLALAKLAPADGSDAWQTPTLSAPWINFGVAGYTHARYRRYADGDVAIEGLIASNGVAVADPSNIFVLPAGYRPAAIEIFPALAVGNVVRQLEVGSTGQVRITSAPAASIAYLTLNCRFSTL